MEGDVETFHEPFIWFPPPQVFAGGGNTRTRSNNSPLIRVLRDPREVEVSEFKFNSALAATNRFGYTTSDIADTVASLTESERGVLR